MPSVRHCSLLRLSSGMATVPRLFELSNSLIGRSGVFKGLHPKGLSPANHGFLRPSSDTNPLVPGFRWLLVEGR